MLTDEQINNLNIGDTLILNNYPVSYVCAYPDGIIDATDDKAQECCNTACFFPLKYLSLPPKHDPCRLFKKGDWVSPMFFNDRPPVASEERVNSEFMPEDGVYEVLADEKNSIVYIDYHGKRVFIPVCHVELVTPVEEREPYIAYENLHVCAVMHRDEKDGKFIAVFFISHYGKTIARERAEAECDRLNAEWRKENANG